MSDFDWPGYRKHLNDQDDWAVLKFILIVAFCIGVGYVSYQYGKSEPTKIETQNAR